MTYTIKKGKHRSWPFIFGLLFHQWMERDVVFDETSEYELGEDQDDVNKLFGWGYFGPWDYMLVGGHKIDSARFGWNYNYGESKIRLFAYCYVNGVRTMEEICEILPHKKVRLLIDVYQGHRYVFSVQDGYNNWHQLGSVEVPFTHNKKLKYKLGCFFGGNNPAPHKITIKISKK